MVLRHALAACVFLVGAACGGKFADDDLVPADAGKPDVHDGGPHDANLVDVAPPPYHPVGKACDPPDAAPPAPWTPDGTAAPIHPPIMHPLGGPVLARPVFVPVTYGDDPFRGPLEDFVASVGCTSYWRSIANDYGVGDAYAVTPVHLATAPSGLDDTGMDSYLDPLIESNALPAPIADQTLYVLFLPETTTVTLEGSVSCEGFYGYHSEAKLSNGHVVSYAIVPRCTPIDPLDEVQTLTAVTSHELMEAVTDPRPFTNPANMDPTDDAIAWALAGGGEVGDLCYLDYGPWDFATAFFQPADYPFFVQHQWSQRSAYAGHDPCQPSTQSVFFAAAPVVGDSISFDLGWGPSTATGVKLAVGQKKTIDVKLVADGPFTGPIAVQAFDASVFGDTSALDLELSPSQGNVGDTLSLTITRTGTSSEYPIEGFALVATSGSISRTWWGAVGDP